MTTAQDFSHPSCKVLVTGTSGTGKTTLYEQLIRRQHCRVWFVYDHQGEFRQRFKKIAVRNADELIDKTAKGGWVVFDPIDTFPGKTRDGFEFFCDYVFEVSQKMAGRKIFCCDEIQMMQDTGKEPENLLKIIETGRRFQIDCFFISQSCNRLHNAVRNQLTEVYTFRQSDSNALKYLEENGFAPDKVRSLPNGRYIHRNLHTGEIREGGKAL